MKLSRTLLLFVVAILSVSSLQSQNAPPAKSPPKPAEKEAPGGAPNKVWVNTASNVYHCPGDRYYGKTKAGKYMTEPEAKAAGAHGVKNTTCFR